MTVEVKDIDNTDKVLASLQFMSLHEIRVGWVDKPSQSIKQSGATQVTGLKEPLTLAQMNFFHEVGTKTLPARPVISKTMDTRTLEIENLVTAGMDSAMQGRRSGRQVMNLIGAGVADMMKDTLVRQVGFAPLKDSTKKRKKNFGTGGLRRMTGPRAKNKARIHTGQSLNAITWGIGVKTP